MSEGEHKRHVHKIELLISDILRFGVIASLSVVVLGTVVTFVHHPSYASVGPELQMLTHRGASFPHTASEVMDGIRGFKGQSIVMAGVLLLIATPVVRVAVSIFAFIYQRDYTFVLITAVVLALLLLSFAIGRTEV